MLYPWTRNSSQLQFLKTSSILHRILESLPLFWPTLSLIFTLFNHISSSVITFPQIKKQYQANPYHLKGDEGPMAVDDIEQSLSQDSLDTNNPSPSSKLSSVYTMEQTITLRKKNLWDLPILNISDIIILTGSPKKLLTMKEVNLLETIN